MQPFDQADRRRSKSLVNKTGARKYQLNYSPRFMESGSVLMLCITGYDQFLISG